MRFNIFIGRKTSIARSFLSFLALCDKQSDICIPVFEVMYFCIALKTGDYKGRYNFSVLF